LPTAEKERSTEREIEGRGKKLEVLESGKNKVQSVGVSDWS